MSMTRPFALMTAFLCVFTIAVHADPTADIIEFKSKILKDNPLHDPTTRKVIIFSPSQAATNSRIPVVYYLPGFGGSSERFIKEQAKWLKIIQTIADEVAPVRVVVVDGRTRWSCSQYLNSPAQGNYADYICDEIVAQVEAKFPTPKKGMRRMIAGHSSGGFGALRLGMMRPKLFDAVLAMSPDSDFNTTHIYLSKDPTVTNASPGDVKAIMHLQAPVPKGELLYATALSAAYAPTGAKHPGEYEWLFDEHGVFRQDIWQRWLDNDPLTLAQQNKNAFRANQAIYLEGAKNDEYQANIGARKIYETIQNRPARCTFYEPPGKHSDHVPERLQRGIAWILEKPVKE